MGKTNLLILILLALVVSMPASAVITHRYDFIADANDVVGGLETVLETGAVVQDGALVLAGGSPGPRAVLDGPDIGINGYTDGVTLEAWYTADALSGWTRVFDFGDTSGGDGGYYLFYTPSGPGNSRLVIASNGFPGWSTGEQFINGPALATGIKYHLVCIYDAGGGIGGNSALRIYQDGVLVGNNENVTMLLSDVHNAFAYLGSAVYPGDPEFQGSIDEFRIYDKPLNAAEVRFTNHFGADDAYPIVLRSMTPENDQDLVSTTPTLSWTPEPDITAASYTLYFGTDPNIADPNIADVSAYSDLVVDSLLTPEYPITTALDKGIAHYWRVDTVAADTTVYQGVGSKFTTIPASPVFIVNPTDTGVFEDAAVVLTASCSSLDPIGPIQWWKVGSPDVQITTADPDVSIVEEVISAELTKSTLTITNVTAAREGLYYAKTSNTAGDGSSTSARVTIKRLLAHYEFEANTNDSSASGLHGTVQTPSGAAATAAYVDSMTPAMGKAIFFSGTGTSDPANTTDPYVDLPDGFDNFTQGITISAWAYPTSTANWGRIVQFGNGTNGANNSFYFTRVGTGTTLRFENDNTNPTNATSVTTGANRIVNNVWQHLVIAVNTNATNNAVIYRNGVAVQTGTVTLPNVVTRTNCYIGRSEWNGDSLYRGYMDDVQVYNYALSAADVAELYTDATPEDDYICLTPLAYDVNADCRVDLDDLKALAQYWLECELVPASACGL